MPRLAQLVEHLTVVGKNTSLSRHQGVPGSSPGAGTNKPTCKIKQASFILRLDNKFSQFRMIMALNPCDECGAMISDKAVSCPHCGFPLSNQINQPISNKIPELNKEENNNFAILICVFLFFSTLFLYYQYTIAEKAEQKAWDDRFDCNYVMWEGYVCPDGADYDDLVDDLDDAQARTESAGSICGVFTIMFIASLIYLYKQNKTEQVTILWEEVQEAE